ncbi:hypothetical protein QPX08_06415 [Corynebacterium propinquum]|uniref:hypothetical protein n=1 Tax=Corynebacterium propinquum TaxID=43769 RepID=UPI000A6FFF43|nr:hypothetical protein [Corynebacterium propinquum]MCG7231811.1 hypothetical protein [Corynebacterium propinquum]MDK4239139.1 hypothetical protein [Corynebacterium propinquum]WKS44442.1 hypothetical protein NLL36_08115 [Corynebacterium propinquum]
MKKLTRALISCIAVSCVLTGPTPLTAQAMSEASVKTTNSIDPSTIDANSDFDKSMDALMQFVEQNDKGTNTFIADTALHAGASEYILRAGEEFNRIAADYDKANTSQARSFGYGNWCGPGHSGPGAPINTLDRICMNHDKCYARKGYFACSCDRQLIADIKANRGKFNGWGENAAALAAATYFRANLCNPLA